MDPNDTFEYQVNYYLTSCITCKGISLYSDNEFDEAIGSLEEAVKCYPREKDFGSEVPLSILKTYKEANRINNISPPAFAVMIRKGLEYLCIDQKAKGRTLEEQLDN